MTTVLLAHGSPDPRHRQGIEEVADGLRSARPGTPVRLAYLETDEPSAAVLGRDLTGDVVVVPMLITPAYHARTDVPRAARELAAGGAQVRVTDPLAPHPLLLDAVVERLASAGHAPDPGTDVLLVAGGSSDGTARRSLDELLVDHTPPGRGRWRGTTLREPEVVAEAVAQAEQAGHRLVVLAFTLAEGVLHDAAERLAAEHGTDFVRGGLGRTRSVVELVALRATPA